MNVFLKTYLFLTAGALVLVAAFNAVIDPYGIFNIVEIDGLNNPKSEVQNHEKLTKAYRVTRIKPVVVALGTSRTDFGIDPRLFATGEETAYNMAMAGADIYVTRRYLEHVIAVRPIKTLVLGLDFFAFNVAREQAPDFSEDYFLVRRDGSYNWDFKSKIFFSSLFSTSAISDAIKTIKNARATSIQIIDTTTGMRMFSINGKRYYSGQMSMLPARSLENSAHARFAVSESMYLKSVYLSGKERRYAFVNPLTGASPFDELRKIVRLCKANHIKAYFFVSPSHARQMELIKVSGLWPLFEQWKRGIVQLVSNDGDANQVVWDFSGYNSITKVDVPMIGRAKQYLDSSHYTSSVGRFIAMKMLGQKVAGLPEDFGVRLTSRNIDSALADIRSKQTIYEQTHVDTVTEIEEIAADASIDTKRVMLEGSGLQLSARLTEAR